MKILGFVLVLLLTFGAAHAEDAVRRELSLRVFEITAADAMVDQMAGATWPTVEASLVQNNEGISDDVLKTMKAKYVELNHNMIRSLSGDIVSFYAQNYSEDELAQLLEFYESDLGKKTLEMSPKMMAEIFPTMMTKIQRDIPKMMQEFNELAKQKGLVVS